MKKLVLAQMVRWSELLLKLEVDSGNSVGRMAVMAVFVMQ